MAVRSDYEILGLPENADKEIVEKKYGALLRQYKQRTDEKGATNEDLEYYREITEAYDRIVGTVHDFTDTNPTSVIPYSVRRWFSRRMAEFESFKFPIVAILLLVVIGTMIYLQFRDTSNEDMSIKFVGAFQSSDQTKLGMEIAEKSDALENPLVTFFTVTTSTEKYDKAAMNQAEQFMVQLMANRVDLILTDTESYDVYLNKYAYLKLDGFIEEYSQKDENFRKALEKCELLYYENKGEDDPLESGIYGIVVTDTTFFDDMDLLWLYNEEDGQKKSMILCIGRTTKNLERTKNLAADIVTFCS